MGRLGILIGIIAAVWVIYDLWTEKQASFGYGKTSMDDCCCCF